MSEKLSLLLPLVFYMRMRVFGQLWFASSSRPCTIKCSTTANSIFHTHAKLWFIKSSIERIARGVSIVAVFPLNTDKIFRNSLLLEYPILFSLTSFKARLSISFFKTFVFPSNWLNKSLQLNFRAINWLTSRI